MNRDRTEAFKTYIEGKERELNDLVCLVDVTADKCELLEEFFEQRPDGEGLSKRVNNGLARILNEIEQDCRLISAEIMADANKKAEAAKSLRAVK